MSQNKNRRKAYRPKQPFISVEGVHSAAFEQLSPHAVFALVLFYKKFNGYNRNNLSLTTSEVSDKMAPGTHTKVIWELIAFGFIDRIRWGKLYKICSIYALSHRWKKLSESPQTLANLGRLLNQINNLQRDKRVTNKKQKVWALQNKIMKVSKV